MGKKKGLKVGIALAAGAGAAYAVKNYKKADNKKKISTPTYAVCFIKYKYVFCGVIIHK